MFEKGYQLLLRCHGDMKAVLFEKYGRPEEVTHLADVDVPTPGEGQVLVFRE